MKKRIAITTLVFGLIVVAWGNGEVTFKVCSKDGTNYTQKITFSVDEERVNFVSETIED